MKNTIKIFLTLSLLIVTKISFADATEDLWKALKSANDANALAAITAGADVNKNDAGGTAPISLAACFSGAEVVKALIDGKANINFVQAANGFTPLMNAANWGNTDAVKLLLAAGADIKPKSKLGITLLAISMSSVKLELIKMIIDAGADPLEKYDIGTIKGLTLMNALIGAYAPKEKVANIAANRSAIEKAGLTYPERMVNAKESDFTPLQDIAQYLLDKGLDPNQKIIGTWGTILFQSIEFGKTGIALALINAKADIEAKGMIMGGEDGKKNLYEVTPLLIAAAKGDNAVVEALIAAGADINFLGVQHKGEVSKSTTGSVTTTTIYNSWEYNTALSLANDNGHPDTGEIIAKHGGLGPKEVSKNKKKK